MNATLRLLSPVALAIVLAGCSISDTISDLTRIEYKSTAKSAPLEIPPDLVSPRRDDRFVVPDRNPGPTTYSAYSRDRAAAPAPGTTVGVLPSVPGTRIERQGAQRWLVVDQPPDRVWPVLRKFWTDSGFALEIDAPETGVMETGWAETRPSFSQGVLRDQLSRALGTLYSTGERDKFRTRLESDGKVTEIFVTHRGLVEEFSGATKERTIWTARPSDPALEAEFLRRIMLRFGGVAGDPATPAGAARGQEPVPPQRATLVDEGGRQFVRLQDGFDRAWRQVGVVLDRTGFTVEDRDRSKGTFFVRYVDPEGGPTKEQGFFSRMFGVAAERDLTGRRYRVVVAGEAQGSRVDVLAVDGKPPSTDLDKRAASQIASLLQEQLR